MGIVAITAAVSGAFTENNTVPDTQAGEGAKSVTGFAVTAVQYNLNATNPNNLDSVQFHTDKAAASVKAKLVVGGSWFTCDQRAGGTAGQDWICTVTGVTASSVNQLDVIAVN